jgi:cysteine desulfurase/selenocysteine lyase
MIAEAHAHEVPVLVDGAQSVPHMKVDVQDLDADFFAFSGHKVYGPTGVGVLYGKEEWLDKLPPYQHKSSVISFLVGAPTKRQNYAPIWKSVIL